jgi:glycosidase
VAPASISRFVALSRTWCSPIPRTSTHGSWLPGPVASPRTFPGEEDSNWRYHARTGQYYCHRFYHFQPKLNPDHPGIQHECAKIASFWLSVGLSGKHG